MPITTLIASGNPNITDAGIEKLPLISLSACNNCGITGKSIRKLKKLNFIDASDNNNITYDDIIQMQQNI